MITNNQLALNSVASISPPKPSIEFHVGSTYAVLVCHSEPLKEECRDFIDCIFSGQNPQSDGETGLRIVNQLEALVKSYSQHGISINL